MSQYRINRRCQLAIAISSCFAGSVWATGTTADITNSAPDTITVTGHPSSYAEENSVSATRTNTPISEIPQSVQVINRKVMDEQNSQNLSNVLVNVSGVRPIRQDEVLFAQPLVRGFPAEIYLDGLPAFGGTAASIDPSSLTGAERIEVLKGPTSALYGGGIGAPLGGLINVVSKRPEAATEGRVGIRTGSYSTVNPWADVNVPLGERVAARVSGSYEKSNSWIDNVKSRNWFLQPSVSFELSPQTELIFTGQYNRRSQIEYSGLPAALAINGDIDRHAYPGATHGQPRTSIENQVSTLALKHWFNDDTTLNVTGRYFDSKVSDFDWLTPQVSTVLSGTAPDKTADPHAEHKGAMDGMDMSGMTMPVMALSPLKTATINRPNADWDSVLNAARSAGISASKIELRQPKAVDKAWTVTEVDRSWPSQVDSVSVNPNNFSIVDHVWFDKFPLVAKLTRWGVDAHMGVLFGLPNQLILAAFGLGLCVMIVLGYRMWWIRRPKVAETHSAQTLPISDLAELFSVSRPTVYRTLSRHKPILEI
nr:TonB-dependent receptor plug domain-containing protein [Erwinia sp. JH02]